MASNSNGRRVVVTGMGFITPIGNDLETVWSNMVEGVSGIGRITRFDTTHFDAKIAGEVKGFNPEDYMDKKTARHIGRFCQFALAASKQALAPARARGGRGGAGPYTPRPRPRGRRGDARAGGGGGEKRKKRPTRRGGR